MKHPSASNAEAFVRCGASHVLPQHEAYHERTESGSNDHDLLTAVVNKHPGAQVQLAKKFPDIGFKLAAILRDVKSPRGETAYVVDVEKRTAEFLGMEIGREYSKKLGRPLKPYEIGVSLDAEGVKDRTPWLRDWKFGTHSSWWQLYIQSMAVLWSGFRDRTDVDAGFIHFRQEDDELHVSEDTATIYVMDLDDRADDLMKAFEYAAKLEGQLQTQGAGNLKTVEGKWCQYCGAYPHCPSKWKLATALAGGMDIVGSVANLTTEQCGAAWMKLREIKRNMVEKTEDALKERMRVEGGFPLENGKMVKLLPMAGRTSVDKDAVVALLRSKGATDKEISGIFKTGKPFDSVREVKR